MSNNCLLGRNGFIGGALAKRIKDFDTTPNKDNKVLYFFASPSSVMLFNKNLDYCLRETIDGFLSVISYCRDNNILLVYPSSATVNNKNNSYAHCKAVLEEIHQAYNIPAIGLRISAGYGVGEGHKFDYCSVIYQWCKQMINDERPVIWGDGTQTRDFIYIDDIVDNIMDLVDKKEAGIFEIGTGVNTSFNEIIAIINKELGKDIKPIYIDKPVQYIQDTPVKAVPFKISIEEGVRRIIKSLKNE